MAVDYKRLEIEFRNTGIHITPHPSTKEEWWEIIAKWLYASPAPQPPPADVHRVQAPLSMIGFDPLSREHRISIKADRITNILFELVPPPPALGSPGWLFVPIQNEAFRIKEGTAGADRFTINHLSPSRRVVSVRYQPQPGDFGSQYFYELRLEAPVWHGNPPQARGHMIIIVDPIIGSDEL